MSLDALASLLANRRTMVLTGAGVSTDSGIPDYRGPGARPRRPVQYAEFVRDPEARRRYWARSYLGWPRFAAAQPNPAHRALARLEAAGRLTGLVTQNVDGLHQAAGSVDVVELHGSLARVRCLSCGAGEDRDVTQARLLAANPGFGGVGAVAPDGDAEIDPAEARDFVVPECVACGGVLKPDVVFFGENVPAPRVEAAWARLAAAEVLLVLGSSLTVWSGYRFARRAAEEGRAVVIVNRGPTRADPLAILKVEAGVGEVLARVVGA